MNLIPINSKLAWTGKIQHVPLCFVFFVWLLQPKNAWLCFIQREVWICRKFTSSSGSLSLLVFEFICVNAKVLNPGGTDTWVANYRDTNRRHFCFHGSAPLVTLKRGGTANQYKVLLTDRLITKHFYSDGRGLFLDASTSTHWMILWCCLWLLHHITSQLSWRMGYILKGFRDLVDQCQEWPKTCLFAKFIMHFIRMRGKKWYINENETDVITCDVHDLDAHVVNGSKIISMSNNVQNSSIKHQWL